WQIEWTRSDDVIKLFDDMVNCVLFHGNTSHNKMAVGVIAETAGHIDVENVHKIKAAEWANPTSRFSGSLDCSPKLFPSTNYARVNSKIKCLFEVSRNMKQPRNDFVSLA